MLQRMEAFIIGKENAVISNCLLQEQKVAKLQNFGISMAKNIIHAASV